MVKIAEQLDPTSMIIKAVLAGRYLEIDENELSLVFANKALEMSPLFDGPLTTKYIKLNSEEIDEGIAKFRKSLKANSNPINPRMGLFKLYLKQGDREAAFDEFAEIIGYPKVSTENCGAIAQLYYLLGKKELAYHWLEKSIANYEVLAIEMAAVKEFEDWQKEPRFREMYKKINHPMYTDE